MLFSANLCRNMQVDRLGISVVKSRRLSHHAHKFPLLPMWLTLTLPLNAFGWMEASQQRGSMLHDRADPAPKHASP